MRRTPPLTDNDGNVQLVRIVKCEDPRKWYARFVNTFVPYIGHHSTDGFKAIEPRAEGQQPRTNLIPFEDSKLFVVIPRAEHERLKEQDATVKTDGLMGKLFGGKK